MQIDMLNDEVSGVSNYCTTSRIHNYTLCKFTIAVSYRAAIYQQYVSICLGNNCTSKGFVCAYA